MLIPKHWEIILPFFKNLQGFAIYEEIIYFFMKNISVYEGQKLSLIAELFDLHKISATKDELQEAYDNIKRFVCLLAEIEIQNLKNDAGGRTLHHEN